MSVYLYSCLTLCHEKRIFLHRITTNCQFWPACLHNTLPHCLKKRHDFRGRVDVLNVKCTFFYFLYNFEAISHSQKKYRININPDLLVKYAKFLSDINRTRVFSTYFSTKIRCYTKSESNKYYRLKSCGIQYVRERRLFCVNCSANHMGLVVNNWHCDRFH
jgi:hypothetical protein